MGLWLCGERLGDVEDLALQRGHQNRSITRDGGRGPLGLRQHDRGSNEPRERVRTANTLVAGVWAAAVGTIFRTRLRARIGQDRRREARALGDRQAQTESNQRDARDSMVTRDAHGTPQ